jgi:hypothetical protein
MSIIASTPVSTATPDAPDKATRDELRAAAEHGDIEQTPFGRRRKSILPAWLRRIFCLAAATFSFISRAFRKPT